MESLPDRFSAFERITLPHLEALSRYANSLTRNLVAAEDLVQDTYLIAAQNWHSFEAGSECRAWLFTICRHKFLRTRKREARIEAVDDPVLETLAAVRSSAAAIDEGLAGAFERAEVVEAVREAIAALPEVYRDVAVLVDLHDYTYESAASILGIPIGTVRSRLYRARRVLQEQLLAHARDLGLAHQSRSPVGAAR